MKWTIDTARSSVEFVVRYVGISTIEGRFTRVRGTIETTEDGQLKAIEAFILAGSVDTGVSERDTHLRSPDFLDAAEYPELTCRTITVEPLSDDQYRVRGEITIRDRTHGTVFQVDASPTVIDGQGRRHAQATATGTFSRREWGLAWDRVLRFGGLLVADEVDFCLNIEAVAAASGLRLAPGAQRENWLQDRFEHRVHGRP